MQFLENIPGAVESWILVVITRQKSAQKRSLLDINEHFKLVFNTVSTAKIWFSTVPEMLEETLALLSQGGIYVTDDMLPQANWPDNHAPKVALLIEALKLKTDFVAVSLNLGSGIIILTRL